ncbi:DUF4442 domain-containing protein [Niabella ginsengisoli]|uniref:DUF4442 domain-containing protein n=1 Tax=Niabella ginsengisoli TaxID=522298 RepID=A0ABS9SIG0_9BACT|nr:DUF4442 domain-containing protein [Niabella ginsengisoli]MCH5598158.1 DUF4442 domain-containing protein [Niabella ginsengisoli]
MSINNDFIELANSPKFNFFLLRKLPSAYFSGVRIKEITKESCSVTVPFKWFSQNPFRSTYFACLAMAAELSTGALAMANVYKQKPGVSMLVVKMEAEYFKKAVGTTTFTCLNGNEFANTVSAAVISREAQILTARSEGRNEQGDLVAVFTVTWSFKAKAS